MVLGIINFLLPSLPNPGYIDRQTDRCTQPDGCPHSGASA